jgi:peptide/nickel transport system permease protein
VLLLLVALAVLAPLLQLHPNQQQLELRLEGPRAAYHASGWRYIMGADELGRPLLSRLVYGARISLIVAFCAPLIAAGIGVTLGLLAAEFRGWVGTLIMRLVDLWMCLPFLLVSLSIVYLTGPGFTKLVITLGIMRWMIFCRLTRALALSTMELPFVEAARTTGCSRLRVILVHVLPNIAGEVIILIGLESARAMLAESALSFLGLGIQPPQSSWGTILGTGQQYIGVNPWIVLFPGLAILITTLSINVTVDALHDRETPVEYE